MGLEKKPLSKDRVAYNRWWREKNRERHRDTRRKWKKANPDNINNGRLKYVFNISLTKYNWMLLQQKNNCACCGKPAETFNRKLAVDHDKACCPGKKSCGKCVRALLCTGCNIRIGWFEDKIFKNNVQKYLRRFKYVP